MMFTCYPVPQRPPQRTRTGCAVQDGDLSMGGVNAYIHDGIYISSFVLMLSVFTDRAWYLYLAVRACVREAGLW